MTPHPFPATRSPMTNTDTKARFYDWDADDTRFPPGWHVRGDVEDWIPVNRAPRRTGTRTPTGGRGSA